MHNPYNISPDINFHKLLADYDDAVLNDSHDVPHKGLDGKMHSGADLTNYIEAQRMMCQAHPDSFLQGPFTQGGPLDTDPGNPSKVRSFYPVIHP